MKAQVQPRAAAVLSQVAVPTPGVIENAPSDGAAVCGPSHLPDRLARMGNRYSITAAPRGAVQGDRSPTSRGGQVVSPFAHARRAARRSGSRSTERARPAADATRQSPLERLSGRFQDRPPDSLPASCNALGVLAFRSIVTALEPLNVSNAGPDQGPSVPAQRTCGTRAPDLFVSRHPVTASLVASGRHRLRYNQSRRPCGPGGLPGRRSYRRSALATESAAFRFRE